MPSPSSSPALLVDYRVGSKELAPALSRLGFDVEIVQAPGLVFGDVAFQGRGAHGDPVSIGIELKTVGDLVNSLRTNRLAGYQLPGLPTCYDYSWLVIEGHYTPDRHGCLTTASKRGQRVPIPGHMSVGELEKRLITFEMLAGIRLRHTSSRADTVRFIGQLYRWWTDRDMDAHHSHVGVHQLGGVVALSPFRQAVCQWPRIGIRTSLFVERHFLKVSKGKHASVTRAATASVAEWASIEVANGKRLGTKVAEAVVRFLEGV